VLLTAFSCWLRKHGLFDAPLTPEEVASAKAINSLLAMRKTGKSKEEFLELWEKV
jgi:hypothetical protein